jgi:hypothetical protein
VLAGRVKEKSAILAQVIRAAIGRRSNNDVSIYIYVCIHAFYIDMILTLPNKYPLPYLPIYLYNIRISTCSYGVLESNPGS